MRGLLFTMTPDGYPKGYPPGIMVLFSRSKPNLSLLNAMQHPWESTNIWVVFLK
jgi:hypothetical protein